LLSLPATPPILPAAAATPLFHFRFHFHAAADELVIADFLRRRHFISFSLSCRTFRFRHCFIFALFSQRFFHAIIDADIDDIISLFIIHISLFISPPAIFIMMFSFH
jgi:hypothetical protein